MEFINEQYRLGLLLFIYIPVNFACGFICYSQYRFYLWDVKRTKEMIQWDKTFRDRFPDNGLKPFNASPVSAKGFYWSLCPLIMNLVFLAYFLFDLWNPK